MSELRDGSSPDLKQKHFVTVIESLLSALHQILDDSKDASQDDLDEINQIDKDGYQFKTNISWEDKVTKRPLKHDKLMK